MTPVPHCQPDLATENARLRSANARLVEALRDMLAGWRYIRNTHGDLYGVGWDRCEEKAIVAIVAGDGAALSEWQPIETAPKDEAIRLWDGEEQFDGMWCCDSQCWIEFNNGDYCDGGYGQAYRLDGRHRRVPTHWHHFLKPPEQQP